MHATTTHVRVREVELPLAEGVLRGELAVPDDAKGVVLFAHGSGSSRHSPRNRRVAGALQETGMATLLFDLLTPAEEQEDELTAALRFDIALLAMRLVLASEWVAADPAIGSLPLGYFGASTGAAAALIAAVDRPAGVQAIVSRGGRPDLAGAALPYVQVPTLLIVGSRDELVLGLNRQAFEALGNRESMLELVPGATHLFEEPGTLDRVTELASRWFSRYLVETAPAG